ncbi:MAG: methyltransferase domain-containing protein [Pseudomonadota bacterium]
MTLNNNIDVVRFFSNQIAMSVPSAGLEQAYQDKSSQYFGNIRRDLIAHIRPGDHKILEIGCSSGATGHALKQAGKASEVVGVELTSEAAAIARERLDRVLQGDIEQMELPFSPGYFDYILCGDVLEHLRDPWGLLARLKTYLRDGGRVVSSIPNIRNWRVLTSLVFRGRWDYAKAGILDSTHVRFFTKRNMVEMFENAGYVVEEVTHADFGPKARMISRLTLKLGEEFLVRQYIVKAIVQTRF